MPLLIESAIAWLRVNVWQRIVLVSMWVYDRKWALLLFGIVLGFIFGAVSC